MGNYPFVLGLSKKKRVRAISEVLKHRRRAVELRTRPSTTKPRRKKNRKKKLRSISTSHLSTSVSPSTRMNNKREMARSFSSGQVSFGLDGTESNSNQSPMASMVEKNTTEETANETSITEFLFRKCDIDQDGLLSKDDLIRGVTENIEVQSTIDTQVHVGVKKLLTPSVWLDEWDNLVTKDVNGLVNVDEFGLLILRLNEENKEESQILNE